VAAIPAGAGVLAVVDVSLDDGSTERYAMPEGTPLWGRLLLRLAQGPAHGFRLEGRGGSYPPPDAGERPLGRDQSNSSYVLGERALVKCYRRLWPGTHPEVETASFLAGRTAAVPAVLGSLHYADDAGEDWAIALVQEYVPDAEDGWEWCRRLVEEFVGGGDVDATWARAVGAVTAELHGALAGLGSRDASHGELRARRGAAERELDRVAQIAGVQIAGRLRAELARFEPAGSSPVLSRIHGDYHVGQILRSPSGYHVVDFEGEPTRPVEQRRALDSPLRDVASMLRSIDHVPLWVLRDTPRSHTAGEQWANTCRAAFLDEYERRSMVLHNTSDQGVDRSLLRAFEAEKAAYEFAYADSFLPEWLPIAAAGAELMLSRAVGE
jgi:maltokinase